MDATGKSVQNWTSRDLTVEKKEKYQTEMRNYSTTKEELLDWTDWIEQYIKFWETDDIAPQIHTNLSRISVHEQSLNILEFYLPDLP